MTAKTGNDGVDEVEAVPAEAETEEKPETGAVEGPARPAAKRKRRVRVIEVIDDEDLDEVLAALDTEDRDAEEEDAPAARPAKAAEPAPEPAPEEAQRRTPVRKSGAAPSGEVAARSGIFGLTMVQAVVVVVLLALLASLAIWQWRTASGLSSEGGERDAVREVASAYGDLALNYNAQNYQSQMDNAQELMGGDLLESFKSNTLPQLGETFEENPEVSLTSKTDQVFVGSVDGRFATAVVMVDIGVRTKDGATSAPATLLRLALAKIDGEWKVTRQYASGTNDQTQNQLQTGPAGGASSSESPAPDEGEKAGG